MTSITSDKVSCVIPHGGTAKYLKETVVSASGQGFSEIIIVNDGGPPNELDFCATIPRVRIIQMERKGGVGNARNRGIKECKTPYVVLLDHDDVLCEGYLNAICAWMMQHQLRCAAATLRYIADDSRRVGFVVSHASDFVLPSGFLSEISLIAEVGFFADSSSEDLIFFRSIRQTTRLTTCPDAQVLYRIHAQSGSSLNAKAWWACTQMLPLYYQGQLTLKEINLIAGEFASSGAIPAGMESWLYGEASAKVKVLSRSAYACWLNRDIIGMARYGVSLIRHLPELGRFVRRKWMPRFDSCVRAGVR
jgi:glycosyltransferase involved in cell wall biosynthesis